MSNNDHKDPLSYWQARALEAERERDELAAMVGRLREFIRNAPVSTGSCMCGGPADGSGCDHQPVDEWDYASEQVLKEPPPTALRHIRAEAVEAAINDDSRTVYTAEILGIVCRVKEGMRKYAQQIREGKV